jgi:hypothetical protein
MHLLVAGVAWHTQQANTLAVTCPSHITACSTASFPGAVLPWRPLPTLSAEYISRVSSSSSFTRPSCLVRRDTSSLALSASAFAASVAAASEALASFSCRALCSPDVRAALRRVIWSSTSSIWSCAGVGGWACGWVMADQRRPDGMSWGQMRTREGDVAQGSHIHHPTAVFLRTHAPNHPRHPPLPIHQAMTPTCAPLARS